MLGSSNISDCRPREAGSSSGKDKDWMPAFAGMTTEKVNDNRE